MTDFWKRPLSRVLVSAGALIILVVSVTMLGTSAPEADSTTGPLICETDSQSVTSPLFEEVMPDVALTSLGSDPVMLYDLGGKKLTAIVTCSYRCPCSDGYAERLQELRSTYEPQGVSFVALHSNVDENAEGMKSYVNKKNYPLDVYQDEGAVCADVLHAAVTPEVFVFTPDWRLQYHGRIDDDKGGLFVTEQTLKNAIDTLLTGTQLVYREKQALGCAIVREVQS